MAANADGGRLSLAPENKTLYSARASKAPNQGNVSDATSHEPEVLIQSEEEECLKRFYATARNRGGDVRAVVVDEHEITPKSLLVEQIEVKDLKIEDLDEESELTQTDTK
jgi:hypothetical protein